MECGTHNPELGALSEQIIREHDYSIKRFLLILDYYI